MNADTARRLSSEQIDRMIGNLEREIASLQEDARILMEERDRRMEAKWPWLAPKSR